MKLRLRRAPARPVPAASRGAGGAFALCSLCLLFGAAAGCFAASFAPAEAGGSGLFAAWRLPFAALYGRALLPAGAVTLLALSCAGSFLLPPLAAAAGFFTAFALCAAARLAGVSAALASLGWAAALWLPCALLLLAAGERLSLAVLRAVGRGARPVPGVAGGYLAALGLYAAASALLCAGLAA